MESIQAIPNSARKSLWRSTGIVASMTMLSRILGFVRDMVAAQLFGATSGSDAFYIAFKIPNFMRRLFAEGAFSQAFVPILSEYQHQRSHEDVKKLLNHIAGLLGTILIVTSIIAMLAAPWLIRLFAPGFDPQSERFLLAADMLRVTYPYLLFVSLAAFAGAILNTYGSFGPPAFTPVLLNLAMIGAAYFISPFTNPPIIGFAWGVFMGGILQLLWLLPYLIRLNLFPIPILKRGDPGVSRILKQMIPAIFGVSVAQINLMFDTLFSSFLSEGSVSWLYFSDRITSLPLGVFGVAIATVTLPSLARHHVSQTADKFSQTVDWSLKNILIVVVPSVSALIIMGRPMLITLFQYGRFHWHDVIMTQKSLIAFSLGIIPFMAVKVLATVFYARQNIRTPVRIAVVAMLVNIGLNVALIPFFAHTGLALATSLAAYLNAGLLCYYLRKQQVFFWLPGWLIFLLRLSLATIAMGLALFFLLPEDAVWLAWRWPMRAMQLTIACAVAFGSYVIALYLSGYRLTRLPAD